MMNVVIYETATGQISRTMRLVDATEAHLNCRPHEDWIEGVADLQRQCVSGGQIVDRAAAILQAADLAAAWAALRRQREVLLKTSDWTQVADAPVDRAAWAAYRAALRDLPQTTLDPFAPVWPTPPQS